MKISSLSLNQDGGAAVSERFDNAAISTIMVITTIIIETQVYENGQKNLRHESAPKPRPSDE
jgi:hypothetical protein